ncbi:MAG TPA: MASE1 domain-containing protein [Spirochaetota bacterium]|nr:MASE1 domain-containing protein [Spirochaetota bacterium]HPJ44368.1 MASE1 domain-containing protein [Spirochaetota bacterium]
MNNRILYTVIIIILAILYYLFGKFAFAFAISYETVTSAIFLSEGIALAFILLYGWRVWPGIFIGQMLLGFATGLNIWSSLFISAGNSAEALVGLWILSRLKFNVSVISLRDYLLLIFIIFAVLQPLSSVIGVTSLYLFSDLRGDDILSCLIYWWMGNSMGQMLLTPMILLAAAILKEGKKHIAGRAVEALVSMLAIGLVSLLIFTLWGRSEVLHNVHAFFLILPVVIWLSLKYDITGAVVSSFVISLIAQIFTVKGVGPFTGWDIQHNLISLNVFIISITLSAGFTGILFYERKVREDKLRHALDEIKTLQGILPICSSCKKIRNDRGYWEQIESYISKHSDAEFTHSLCDDCVKKIYGKNYLPNNDTE